jgi:hypothetical protein
MIRRVSWACHVEELEAVLTPMSEPVANARLYGLADCWVIDAESCAKISEVTAAAREEYSDNED